MVKDLVLAEKEQMRKDAINGWDFRCEDGPDQPCWFYIFRHW